MYMCIQCIYMITHNFNSLDSTSGSCSSNCGTAHMQPMEELQTANVSRTSPTAAASRMLTYMYSICIMNNKTIPQTVGERELEEK